MMHFLEHVPVVKWHVTIDCESTSIVYLVGVPLSIVQKIGLLDVFAILNQVP